MNKALLVGIALVIAVGVAIGSALTARIAAGRAETLASEIDRQKQAVAALEKSLGALQVQVADARTRTAQVHDALTPRLDALEKKDPFAAMKKQEADRIYEQLRRDVDQLKQQLKK